MDHRASGLLMVLKCQRSVSGGHEDVADLTLVVFLQEGELSVFFFFICERMWNVVKARVVTAHSFVIVYPLRPPPSPPSPPPDPRKNFSTWCKAVMMDWSLFPTHFNELKLRGVLLVANSRPAHYVAYGASRLVNKTCKFVFWNTSVLHQSRGWFPLWCLRFCFTLTESSNTLLSN